MALVRAGPLFLACLAPAGAVVSARSWFVFLAGVAAGCAGCDAARSVALEAGGRRYPLLTLTLTFGSGVRGACLCCQVVEPFLTSPPRVFLDGGVRSGTVEPASRRVAVLAGAANARGWGAQWPHGGLAGCAPGVRGLCGRPGFRWAGPRSRARSGPRPRPPARSQHRAPAEAYWRWSLTAIHP